MLGEIKRHRVGYWLSIRKGQEHFGQLGLAPGWLSGQSAWVLHLAEKAAPVWLIHSVNVGLLALLMVGVPAITGFDLGSVRISSATILERLVLAGLMMGLAANGIMGWTARRRRQQMACRGWVFIHGAILLVGYAAHINWIDFRWFRRLLEQIPH